MSTKLSQQLGGINALNYYFTVILVENLNMSDLMARILTGVNATSYTISTAMAFWVIERAGRRFLMLWGLVLQGFAYVMVAIAVGSLSSDPQAVSHSITHDIHTLTFLSGEELPLHSCSSTMRHLDAHGAWCLGSIKPRSTPSECAFEVLLLLRR